MSEKEKIIFIKDVGLAKVLDYNPTEEELQKIIQFEEDAEESIENNNLERVDIKQILSNETKFNESDEKLCQTISDEIDKLGFEDTLSSKNCCFIREGNYRHKICYDGFCLFYTNDKDNETRKYIVKNMYDVKKAFKDIAQTVEGME